MKLHHYKSMSVNTIVKYFCLTIVFTCLYYLLWLLMRIFLADQFITPTESMMPTLLPGDRIVVDKTIMGARIYSDFNFDRNGMDLKSWRTRGKTWCNSKRHSGIQFSAPQRENQFCNQQCLCQTLHRYSWRFSVNRQRIFPKQQLQGANWD